MLIVPATGHLVAFGDPTVTTSPDTAVSYQIDAAHDGDQPSDSLTSPLATAPKWDDNLGSTVSFPLIANGLVYVIVIGDNVTSETTLYALHEWTVQSLGDRSTLPGVVSSSSHTMVAASSPWEMACRPTTPAPGRSIGHVRSCLDSHINSARLWRAMVLRRRFVSVRRRCGDSVSIHGSDPLGRFHSQLQRVHPRSLEYRVICLHCLR